MSTHTATPWTVEDERGTMRSLSGGGRFLLRSKNDGSFGVFVGFGEDGVTTDEEDAANAALIVRAVNCHADLLAALEVAEGWIDAHALYSDRDDQYVLDLVRAAIEKAQAEGGAA